MDKDRVNKQLRLSKAEWIALGRKEVPNTSTYSVPFSLASSLANDAIRARDGYVGIDETQYPAGPMRNDAVSEKQRGIAVTTDILQGLAEFLPREISFGDKVEADLHSLED